MSIKTLTCDSAVAESLTRYRSADKGKSYVLVLRSPLTPEIADTLQCRDMVYDLNDRPRQFEGAITLEHKITDAEFSVAGVALLKPTLVHKFRISHSDKADEDADNALEMVVRLQFVDFGAHLNTLMDKYNDKSFLFTLVPLQQELFEDNAKKKSPTIEATSEEIAEGETEDSIEANLRQAEVGSSSLAPAATMGGTHQAKRGRGRPRKVVVAMPAVGGVQ
jgi:hypothetical protein